MPAETKTNTAVETETPTKGKKSSNSSSKAALARITLLDGSILDVTIDVSTYFPFPFIYTNAQLKNFFKFSNFIAQSQGP